MPQRDRRDRGSNPRRESRSPGALMGALRLVGGIEAAASPTRNGHRCATVGPRAFVARVGQSTLGRAPEVGRPATAAPGGPGRRRGLKLVVDVVCLFSTRW